jgi:hypothetical protein
MKDTTSLIRVLLHDHHIPRVAIIKEIKYSQPKSLQTNKKYISRKNKSKNSTNFLAPHFFRLSISSIHFYILDHGRSSQATQSLQTYKFLSAHCGLARSSPDFSVYIGYTFSMGFISGEWPVHQFVSHETCREVQGVR